MAVSYTCLCLCRVLAIVLVGIVASCVRVYLGAHHHTGCLMDIRDLYSTPLRKDSSSKLAHQSWLNKSDLSKLTQQSWLNKAGSTKLAQQSWLNKAGSPMPSFFDVKVLSIQVFGIYLYTSCVDMMYTDIT